MEKKLGFHRQNRFPVKKSLTNNRQNLRYVAFFVFCIKKLDNSMKRFFFCLDKSSSSSAVISPSSSNVINPGLIGITQD